ncbi:manganese efflux pump MntP [Rahnella woolbedingensis]|uniref:Putative manganese efflux pump MntP n=1 Tax=Rahnella woolbedingensis TaxID=1510574 RepID=A0A419NC94_9GAMM|nr:manganese efflux pump MntP [Rahnella woolbedingensis]RJT45824.1 manganese efflux pump MntP [Rahnella woolbedingensis]
MNLSATLILAFGMSMDAFAASIGKGAVLHRPCLREALRTGLIFGVIEAITPLIGWGLGLFASQYITQWSHWVAFILLVILGTRMIAQGLKNKPDESLTTAARHSIWILAATAIGTSLDALAIGVGLALLEVNIIQTALFIGMATLLMSTLGIMAGRFIGPLLGKWAEVLGGVVLIGIGLNILFGHPGYLH